MNLGPQNDRQPGNANHRFYSISMSKLTVLYFGTVGYYSVFWFYRLWRDLEVQTGRKFFPVIRALFAVFFVHELFRLIQKKDPDIVWRPNQLAWFYILINILQLLFFVVIANEEWGSMAQFLSLVCVVILQYYVVYQGQLAVNRIADDAFGKLNEKMTLENQLWMAFGIFMWVRYLIVSLNPADTPNELPGTMPVTPEAAPAEPKPAAIKISQYLKASKVSEPRLRS